MKTGFARLSRLKARHVIPALVALAVLGGVVTHAPTLGLLGTQPVVEIPARDNPHPRFVAVFLSGDMGFHFGMSGAVTQALAAHGIPVVGISSPVVFARTHTRAETQAVVDDAIRLGLARTGASRVLLMGQSYGADIVATTAPHLPADLKARIAAIDVTVPALDVYFRADPSSLAYLGTPDARPLADFRRIDWAPVTCVYGVDEEGSLCPALEGTRVRVIGLPGNHHLEHDHERVIETTLGSLRAAVPGLRA